MKKWTSLILFLTASLSAREASETTTYFTHKTPPVEKPWLTGPLLTPSGHVVPTGHQNYEPYVYWTQANGAYDAHWNSHARSTFTTVLTQASMQFGLMPRTEFDLSPQFVYNHIHKEHMWRLSDLPISLSFQLTEHSFEKWYPAIKLRLGANLPLGKYDHLRPSKVGCDAGGVGDWLPSVGLVFAKLHHIRGKQFFAWRLFPHYVISTSIPVKGMSVYGGTKVTKGRVRSGNTFSLLLGMEYSLTQNWALALDFQYKHTKKLKFSGSSPVAAKPSAPSQEQFALAPAIEYNWSSNLGLIAGPWLTLAGKNTSRFITYVVAINIYH